MQASSESSTPLSTRRKNCNSCVQSKRRCDRRTPICSLCAKRGVPCTYGKQRRGVRHGSKLDTPFIEVASPPDPSATWFDLGMSLDMGPLVDTFIESQPESGYPTATPGMLSQTLISNEIPMEMFDSSEGANTSYPNSTHLEIHMLEGCDQSRLRLGSPADDDIMKSWEFMDIFCSDVQPWHLHDTDSRLHFVTDRVKAFPGQIADCNAAPFLHQNLYQDSMPRCILSCFSTCVLYTKRAPANTGMVLRTLQNNARDLVDGESDQKTPLHRLARTQALFIYQIIRLFDGDISLRAQGEKDMRLLQTWLDELCCLRNNLGDSTQGGESLENQSSPTWKEWMFDESVRRTIIMAYSVIGLYDMMKEPGEKLGYPGPWAYIHRWTLGGSLWKAKSASEFERLWRRNQHFVISSYSFERFIAQGKGEEIDDFAEILLSVYLGVDETKRFMAKGTESELATVG